MPVTPNAIDLTTLAAVKGWTGASGTADDQIVQDCITAFAAYVLHLTGRGPSDGTIPAGSPFVSPQAYNETYDGNGTARLFLRNWPIVSVEALTIGPLVIPQSTAWNVPGWVIDGSAKSLSLRGGGGGRMQGVLTIGFSFGPSPYWGGTGYRFGTGDPSDVQAVNVQYTAGFPTVPFDLEMTARKVVALNYKRKAWIGQKSQAMAAGAGTVVYGQWEMDPDCMRVIEHYKRR